jgi:hypothetical protein
MLAASALIGAGLAMVLRCIVSPGVSLGRQLVIRL